MEDISYIHDMVTVSVSMRRIPAGDMNQLQLYVLSPKYCLKGPNRFTIKNCPG